MEQLKRFAYVVPPVVVKIIMTGIRSGALIWIIYGDLARRGRISARFAVRGELTKADPCA